jgi:hypothetical protein|tara:strand:+ start:4624 stop:5220 length:597 start_codon:yes stop_codon:yes gene_type:complete
MKKIALIITFFLISSIASSVEKVIVVAIVNNFSITNIDIMNEIKLIQVLNNNIGAPNDILKEAAIKNLVDDIVKSEEVKANNIEIDSKIIRKKYSEILRQINEKTNNTSESIKEKIYSKIKLDYEWNSLVSKKYYWNININMDEINEQIKEKKFEVQEADKRLALKETLIEIEKNKKIQVYAGNYLDKIKKQALIKKF